MHSEMTTQREPVNLFLSYAHEDESLLKELEKHLSLLQRQGLISTWQDRRIAAGTNWTHEIDEHLNSASVILLLISADFLASDYCYGIEMQRALQRHETDQARVIPILLRSCDWKSAPFAHLQILPTDARPIMKWPDKDDAWTDVTTELRRVVKDLPRLYASTPPAVLPPISIAKRPSFIFPRPLQRRVSRRAILIAGVIGAIGLTFAEISEHTTTNPLLVLYRGHREAVWRVRWSPDGRRIASGGGDHTVQIWYAYSGRPFYTYYGDHNTNIRAIAWSPDSTHLASGGDDKTVQVRDVATGHLIYVYRGNANIVWDVAWSPDGSLIASAGWDRTVQVWNAQTGQPIYTYRGHSDTVRSISWSPDSTRIASASRDLLVQVWEVRTGRAISSYSGHPTDTLMCVAWSPNGNYIASSGWDKTVQVWEAITGNHIYTYPGHTEVVMEVAWPPDSKRIASASADKTVQVWEATTGSHAYTYRGHTSRVYSVTWSPDGKYLASGQDRAVHVWQPD